MAALLLAFLMPIIGSTMAYGTGAGDEDIQVLKRGPIHEAFAEVSVDQTQPELVIRRSVPEPLNEVPPDYRPNVANVQWIPGYWSWDEDLDDFIWVSGVWRDIPPGRQWVAGYWTTVDGGSQYVSGYWADSRGTQAAYLPPPPAPPPTAPPPPAYASDSAWIDGYWLWSGNRYVWQAGYWQPQRADMLWIPAHYSWTPRGYIFVPGYWDYLLVRRGVIYAPYYYPRPVYLARHYHHIPSVMLDIDVVFHSLYIRRDHHHYYFGDYHHDRDVRRGFYPWYSQHATRHGYDPHYRNYSRYRLRDDDQWEHKYRQQFEYHRDHQDSRPPQFHQERQERRFAGERHSDYRTTDRDRRDSYRQPPDARWHPQSPPERSRDDRQNRQDNRHMQARPRPLDQPNASQAIWQQQTESDRPRLERPARESLRTDDGQPGASHRERKIPRNLQERSYEQQQGGQEPPPRQNPRQQTRQQRPSPMTAGNQNYERTPPPEEATDPAQQLGAPQQSAGQEGQNWVKPGPRWRPRPERVETK